MAKDYKRRAVSSALLLSLLFTGCGEKSECDIPTNHVHKYTKEVTDDIQLEKYLNDEHLINSGYNWNEDYIEITEIDEDLYNLIGQKGLFYGEVNWDFLYYQMANHHDYLEFYYEYDTVETYTTTDSKGNTQVKTRIVHHDGWTDNPNRSDNTGKTRLYHHKYFGYRVVKKDGRFILERSPLVDDIREVIDEYPYFNENCFTTVYEQFSFSKWELDSLRPEDFDIFKQPDLENHELYSDKNKVFVKKAQ